LYVDGDRTEGVIPNTDWYYPTAVGEAGRSTRCTLLLRQDTSPLLWYGWNGVNFATRTTALS